MAGAEPQEWERENLQDSTFIGLDVHRATISVAVIRLVDVATVQQSVIDLLEAVVAFVVAPIDEDGSMIDTWTILAPALKAHMSQGKGRYGRLLPREIALGPVAAEDHGCASVAIPIAPRLVLSCIPNIEDADGAHEIEFWPTDINVRAILYAPEGAVGGNEVFNDIWGAPSSLDQLSKVSRVARREGLAQSSAVDL